MHLATLDWIIIAGTFVLYLAIGLFVGKSAGKDYESYFLSGRTMPWWLLGTSMVATTFATDTPNLVAGIVRRNGVFGNWVWWALLLTGTTTVFLFAKLWRRSGMMTDIEFYELRYSGKPAAFLRGFRAVYLGIFFNILVMANVSLAAIKIGGVMFGLDPMNTIVVASVVTVAYSMVGGLTGVLLTDLVQFIIAMIGAIWAAVHVVGLPQVGGLGKLLADPRVQAKMDVVPNLATTPHDVVMAVFLIPLLVTWWSIYYPGAEPGGGGYVAQRLLAAKNEKHALGACLFFNVMHYALRPWPWILVALASLVVFPDVASLQARFPHLDPKIVQDDLAYPAMLTFLPQGLMGIMVASLAAAFMSTMSTQVNYGSSIVVSDLYLRFVNPKASDSQQVWLGRMVTVVLMFASCWLALQMKDALSNFNLMMQVGAGTGLVLILRWFWWRINAAAEIAAMTLSFGMALFWHYSSVGKDLPEWKQMVVGVAVTTGGSLLVALLTGPTEAAKLREFYSRVQPGGSGWKPILDQAGHERVQIQDTRLGSGSDLGVGITCSILASIGIWSLIFAGGWAIYGRWTHAGIALAVTVVCGALLPTFIGRLRIRD